MEDPAQPSPEGHLDDVLIMLDRPSELPETRSDRYGVLRGYSDDTRRRVEAALAAHGLTGQAELGESTGFSMLMARATPRAVECIQRVPGVHKVLPVSDEIGFELLGPVSRSRSNPLARRRNRPKPV